MQTPYARRVYLAKAGFAPPIPSLDEQRSWQWIDDRIPPEGEADGEFSTHIQWVNKASSWIGWTGAKCFDAKDRICRSGADFACARDEGAFPVRWYWPERFARPEIVSPRHMRIRLAIATAGADGITLDELRQQDGLKRVTGGEIDRVAGCRCSLENGRYVMASEGIEQTQFEASCERRASYVRR